ncbi:MAG: aminopeptidase [Chlorobi bacterium]|nr:aminopeptidase [Chlorobiota bacterium]
MKKANSFLPVISLFILLSLNAFSQKKTKKDKSEYKFTTLTEIKTTSVKNQCNTGTCWSFATNSFIETELIRMGFEPIDLSEMYIVRNTYPRKAINYIQMHGMANFSEGGQAHDDMETIRQFGLVPESVYPGIWDGEKRYNHDELVNVLTGYLSGVVKQINIKLSTRWIVGFNGILDAYFGENVKEFDYDGKTYTPLTFAQDYLKFNPDNYVEITSYKKHPYYSKFKLEVPDNWSHDEYYNVPIEDLMSIINYALENNYSVDWDGDMSERTFSHRKKLAIIPKKPLNEMSREEKSNMYKKPIEELEITPELREKSFDNMTTTDDHLMHLVGSAKDQNGTIYYLTKNSWGAKSNDFNGYLYMSESYVEYKTIAIMVHKDAIPAEIKEKLKL